MTVQHKRGPAVPANDAWGMRQELLTRALQYPGAEEHHPWGETVVKVSKKVFVFLGGDDSEEPGIGVKLREAHEYALSRAGVVPSGYGLGASGWVSVRLTDVDVPIEELWEWVDESYRLVAPKRLVRLVDDAHGDLPAGD